MKYRFFLLMAISFLAVDTWADSRTIHKCKNAEDQMVYQKDPCAEGSQAVTAWTAPIETRKVKTPLLLEQSYGGHYFLDSEVNGLAVKFIVDTGASVVSLPAAVANAANINCSGQIRMDTANGSTSACTGIINKLKFGSFVLKDVTAAIVPNLSQPLMGMNILEKFTITQNGDTLKIAEPD